MRILICVRGDVGVVGSGFVCDVSSELRKGNGINPLRRGAGVGEIDQRIVPARVIEVVESQKTGIRQIHLIRLPGQTFCEYMPDDVVYVKAGGGGIIHSDGLASHEPKERS